LRETGFAEFVQAGGEDRLVEELGADGAEVVRVDFGFVGWVL
jgi:hypothetical protein